jgi:hypothetical protein
MNSLLDQLIRLRKDYSGQAIVKITTAFEKIKDKI